MKFSPTYQMTFSLMNGNPDSMHVDWDIEAAIASKALIKHCIAVSGGICQGTNARSFL
jgi:hypothetical protein